MCVQFNQLHLQNRPFVVAAAAAATDSVSARAALTSSAIVVATNSFLVQLAAV